MSFLKYAFGANYFRFLKRLKLTSKKENRSFLKLLLIFVICFLKYGAGLTDFLNYRLWDKTTKQRKEYVTIKNSDIFYSIASPEKYKTFFTVKNNFLSNFKKFIDRDWLMAQTCQFEEFENFCKINHTFIVKPIDGLAGKGVKKINITDQTNLKLLFEQLKEDKALVEQLIKNHQDIKAFAPNSCNTIRMVTFANNGKAELLYAVLRVGSGADIDNFHAGGIGVMVDLESGKLSTDGVNKQLEKFEYHPVSKIKFKGYQLPNWEVAKQICLDAALVNQNIHIVGWDVAITPIGATFVEGNRRPGFDLPQVVDEKGYKFLIDEVYEKLNIVKNKSKQFCEVAETV